MAETAPPLPRTPPPPVSSADVENDVGGAAAALAAAAAAVALPAAAAVALPTHDADNDDAARAEEVLSELERSVDALLLAQNSLPRASASHANFNARAGRQIVRLLRAFPDANAATFLAFLNPSQLEEINKLLPRKGNF